MLNFFYFPLGLGLLLGCGSLYGFNKLPSTVFLLGINVGILTLYIVILLNLRFLGKLKSAQVFHYFFILIFSASLGLSWATYQSCRILKWNLSESQIHQPIEISGKVQGLPIHDSHHSQFELVLDTQEGLHPIVRLFWAHPSYRVIPGDRLKLKAVLTPPHTLVNPGSFENEKHHFIKGIRAVGKVKEVLAHEADTSWFSFARFRYHLFYRIENQLKSFPFKGIMTALIVGEKTDMSASQFEVLQKTGTSHLIAISGLHVSLIAGTLFFISGWCWRRGYKAYERLHWISAQKVGAYMAIASAFIYAALAGWSIPTQRAFVMVCVAMLGCLWQRQFSPWFLYCMALIVVLVITPLAPFNAGFWLSFLAVGTLIFVFSGWNDFKKTKIQTWLAPQWTVFIGLLPLSFLFFQQTTLVGPLANLVAIPVTSFLVVPLNLLGAFCLAILPGIPSLGGLFLKTAHLIWSGLWIFLEALSHFPLSILEKGYFSISSIVLACLGCFLLLMPKGLPGKYLGFIAWLPLLLGKAPTPISQNEIWFSLLEVGQGLSAVIQTQNHVLVYDTGPRSSHFDAGSQVVVPFLKSQGIDKIDTIMVSHSDLDHRGGLGSILKFYKPQKLLTAYPSKVPEMPSDRCEEGQHWQWDGVNFEVLSPQLESTYYDRPKDLLKTNNQSCVLKITTGENSILLTGDIEAIAEKELVEKSAHHLKSRILVVPHHGSKGSSTQAFIEKVAPEYALFSVGYYNAFGFPKPEAIERYQLIGSQMASTALQGMIQFRFDAHSQRLQPVYRRPLTEKFWNQA